MSRPLPRLLLVEDDASLADQLKWGLKDLFQITHAPDRPRALESLGMSDPHVVLMDLCLPPDNVSEEGFRILREAVRSGGAPPVVVMSALEEREAALRAVADGAYDFFPKPVDLDSLRVVLRRAVERQQLEAENRRLKEELKGAGGVAGLVGSSPAMRKVAEAIDRLKGSPLTVSIEGESGTGKEVVARAIHAAGSRRDRPFVPIHCAAFPETLLEDEIFGHEKGAFTGAESARVGRFEAADGGTLFLDEVGCLSPSTQMKLLRVIEERAVERLGSNKTRAIDIRLIAASNEDLESKVARGEFRRDLFYRINVFRIHLPPLRERREDIPLLAEHFLDRIIRMRGMPRKRFSPAALRALMARDWPGNARQLLNVVETLMLTSDGEEIRAEELPEASAAGAGAVDLDSAGRDGFKAAVDAFERRLLAEAIARSGGVKSRAAKELGLAPGQMKHYTKKHGL